MLHLPYVPGGAGGGRQKWSSHAARAISFIQAISERRSMRTNSGIVTYRILTKVQKILQKSPQLETKVAITIAVA
jgi:hypothetical protein